MNARSSDGRLVASRARALATVAVLMAAIAAGPVEAHAHVDDGSASWLRVDLSGADTCSGASDLGARIERRLGRSPEDAARSLELAMVARIERRPASESWAGEIDVVGPDGATTGRRTLEQGGVSCEALVDRLAFVAAMILDSGTATSSARSRIDPAPTASAATVASSPRVDKQPMRPPWTLKAEGGAALAVGLLPGSAAGGEVSILAGTPGLVAYVSAGFWPEERASVAPNQGAALSLAMAGAGICPARWRATHLGLDLCLGADLGRLRARGFGLDNQATSDRWAADVSAGGDLRWPTGRGLYLALGVRLVVPFVRDQIAYLDSSGQGRELFRMSPLAGVGSLRLGYSHE